MDKSSLEVLFKEYDGIICLFRDDDIITFVNTRFADKLGYTIKEIEGTSIFDFINPEDRTEFTNGVFVRTENVEVTVRFYHKNGSHLYYKLHSFKLSGYYLIIGSQLRRNFKSFNFDINKEDALNTQNNDMFNVSDISEALEDNFQSLRIALDNLPIDFWLKDKDHRYLYMNEIMLKRTNIEGNAYFHKNDFELFERDVANDFVTSDMEAIKARKKTQYTFESKSARFVKWTEVSKVPLYNTKNEFIGLIGCAIDITQTKGREAELENENIALREMLKNMYDLIIYLDQNGSVKYGYNTIDASITQQDYIDCIAENPHFNAFTEAGYNQVESNFVTTFKGHSVHVVIKPIEAEDAKVKLMIVGKKVHHE